MNLVREIIAAGKRIENHILKTPVLHSPFLSELNSGEVFLKLESEQYTGSFKARGALNKILKLSDEEKRKGLIAASTGNHGQGFARAVGISGTRGTIILPENTDPSKVEALKSYDVRLEFFGKNSLEAELHAKSEALKRDMIWVSPYNDYDVIAGQGTIGLEITSQLDHVDAVLGCIGGGGMMSGVSTWMKHESPMTRMVGCLPENSPEMYLSVQQDEVVILDNPKDTLSDGSAGGLEVGAVTFDICRKLVDDYILVNENEIAKAIRYIVEKHHKIIEGSAGVSVASFIKNPGKFRNQRVVIIICGANINAEKLKKIL